MADANTSWRMPEPVRLGTMLLGMAVLLGAAPASPSKPVEPRKRGGNPLSGYLGRGGPRFRLRRPIVTLPSPHGNIRLPKVVPRQAKPARLNGAGAASPRRSKDSESSGRPTESRSRRGRPRHILRYYVGRRADGKAAADTSPNRNASAAPTLAKVPLRPPRPGSRFVKLPRVTRVPMERRSRCLPAPHAGRFDVAYYLQRGREAFAAGDYRQAGGHFLNAGSAGGYAFRFDVYYAQCRLAVRDYRTAALVVHRAVRRRPAVATAEVDVLALYADPERFEGHLAALKQRVESQPDAFLPVFLLGYQYHSSRRPDLAVRYFRRAAALRPGDAAVAAFLSPRGRPPSRMVRGPCSDERPNLVAAGSRYLPQERGHLTVAAGLWASRVGHCVFRHERI